MAARENQGYLIAVIILVLLTLILALAAFLGLSKAGENSTSLIAAEHKLKLSNSLSDAYRSKSNIMEALIGDLGRSVSEVETELQIINQLAANKDLDAGEKSQIQDVYDSIVAIQEAYKKDMLGANATEEGAPVQEQTYSSRVQSLIQLVASKNKDNQLAAEQTQLAEDEALSRIQQMQTLLATNEQTLKDLNEQLEAEKKRSLAKETELKSELTAAVDGNKDLNEALKDFQEKSSTAMRNIQNKIAEVETANEGLKTKINFYEREVFDRPDGEIVKVASRLKSVFINIGSEDGLPANATFSIYPQDELDFAKGKHKAKIEVTRIYPFRAEARITEEDPTDPILEGDKILTPTWDPGVMVPFAVAGTFDLDGDQYDDRDKLIQIIERNGGKVVARHDDEGNIEGKIDYTVRFIVIGDPPSLAEDAKTDTKRNASAIQSAMREMTEMAKKNTVDQIDLQKLLNKMGVRAKPKTLQMETGSRRFPDRQPSDAAAGN